MLTMVKKDLAAGLQRLAIDRVQHFDGNPRLVPNPEHARIKASVRESGLMQPLSVTKEPASDVYLVEAGGNTRLQVLKELYTETGEDRFAAVECIIRPWVSYDHVVVAHLKENDLRGGLTFIEKSLAICALEKRLNMEACKRRQAPLSQRALANRLHREGFGINQSYLSYMHYAVDRLLSPLGAALRNGLGRPTIVRLRRLDHSAKQLWTTWNVDSQEAYDETFLTLCKRYDNTFDIDALRRDLEYEISECAELSLEFVRLALNACIEGDDPPPKPARTDHVSGERCEIGSTMAKRLAQIDGSSDSSPKIKSTIEHADTGMPSIDRSNTGSSIALQGLRTNAYEAALSLAQDMGIGELVIDTPNRGIGFLIADFPDAKSMEQRNDDERNAVSFLWWTLVALCEVTVMPANQVKSMLSDASRLKTALVGGDANALSCAISSVDSGQIAHRFWNVLDSDHWTTLINLMEIYRTLRSCFSPDEPLWKLQ